ncbi:MAG: bifunctional riboflavin kinase/FAD synthetase [Alphaproteobacteria bacterium]
MQIIKSLENFPRDLKNSVLAIGNFDGVHKGHCELLKKAQDIANAQKTAFGVLTFEPHPRKLFRPDDPPFRITPSALKLERLEKAGADFVCELHFDWDFASQSAEHFIQHILKDSLAAAHVVIGYDFCFGQLRKGTPQTIIEAGIDTIVLEKVCDDGQSALSSSRVRQALRHGKIREANDILGWQWEIRGEVKKGDQRGRDLGYPTANMGLGDCVHPAYGVYAVQARLAGEKDWRNGAANIGIRPMFEVPTAQVETFIFDFEREIYGQTLCVRPVKKLRGEAKFNSLEELIAQMDKDCAEAREILQ